MDFYDHYHTLHRQILESNNCQQLELMEEIRRIFEFYFTQFNTANSVIRSEQIQKSNLENSIKQLKQEMEIVSEELISLRKTESDLNKMIGNLNITKRKLKKEVENLESSYKSKAIGKGIYETRNCEVTQVLLRLNEYVTNNRCKSKETLGQQVKQKITAALKICRGSKSVE